MFFFQTSILWISFLPTSILLPAASPPRPSPPSANRNEGPGSRLFFFDYFYDLSPLQLNFDPIVSISLSCRHFSHRLCKAFCPSVRPSLSVSPSVIFTDSVCFVIFVRSEEKGDNESRQTFLLFSGLIHWQSNGWANGLTHRPTCL